MIYVQLVRFSKHEKSCSHLLLSGRQAAEYQSALAFTFMRENQAQFSIGKKPH